MIRALVVAAALTLAGSQPSSTTYLFSYFVGNGEDGLHFAASDDGVAWTPLDDGRSFLAPAVGSRLMRDPSIARGRDGVFHMVWTSGWWDKGIGLAHSKDLRDWSAQQFVPVMAHEPDAQNCWAPEIFLDAERDRFLIYWSTTIPGRFPQTEAQGEKLSRGDKMNHRIYVVETRDFTAFSPARLLYDGGFNAIDAFIVRAGRDRYVMVLKDETVRPMPRKHLRIAEANRPDGPYGAASGAISIDWVEGPSVLPLGGGWIAYYDEYTRKRYGAIWSDDLKRWRSVPVSFPAGARHGTAFAVPSAVAGRLR
jgi:hypothetical protein